MDVISAVVWTLHVALAALWTGSVLFVTAAVLPTASAGSIGTDVLGAIVGRLRMITRGAALVLLLTGGHMAATIYTVETLTGTGRGHLVLTMTVLWLVLAGLVEVAGSRIDSGIERDKLREPAREARPFLLGASAVSILLLITAGLLASNAIV